MNFPSALRLSVSALLTVVAVALFVPPSFSLAGGSGSSAAQASKKKCGKGKVRKQGKCVRKGSGAGGAGGPLVRPGSYTCFDGGGTLYIHGATYDVNQGKDYPYRYSPSTKIITFVEGDYESFYGVWEPGEHDIEIRADYKDEYTSPGDYLWTCGD
jgi:hypothetical protein